MRKLTSFNFVCALACAPAALAQEATISVDISAISADLATELDVEANELPTAVMVSPDVAAVVCGVDVSSLTDTCVATTSSTELTTQLGSEIEIEVESNGATESGQDEGDEGDDGY
ncbi:hypothetical protein [Devosia nitrariae]|uniref:Uncharacterized protein n=1 Tax=Devosia nitrariae TaxID=2071872 RepID=A0ABQ5WBV4_9HYPH|nr:hypothetical protein [Devosia nitrariae]GLQ57274.1 hypothetical protein GCM10010862_45330 [Devosia nitrariae]